MKKRITKFFVMLFLMYEMFAQTNIYYPFPEHDAMWCCSFAFSAPPDCYLGYSIYIMKGTQLINGQLYHIIVSRDSIRHEKCTPPIHIGLTIIYDTLYIRQDSNLKVVWLYDASVNGDKVLYNFNLSVGDTLDTTKVYFANMSSLKIITSIDSVLINGKYRKRYNYNTGCNLFPTDTSMIEGIGALHGLIYPTSCFEAYFYLNAFYQNNTLLYGSSGTPFPCYDFTTNISENISKADISVFPNPTTDKIYFENLPNEKINLQITNIIGQNIYSVQIENRNTFSLSLEENPRGIYFISIQTSSGIFTKKFIKQ